uniref:Cilia and flagella associated protein 119 n=1 Tax=Seriola dumerili TaxID=41447 RepID=A0A3B4TB47_SERDU
MKKHISMHTHLQSSRLSSVLGVDLPEPKRGVLLELYVQTVLFSRECSFKKEQTSALLSIIKSIHEANIETPLNNIEQCFIYCKELILCHSVRRPPFSVDLFSSKEVNCIFEYIHNSYMRHYKLYKYIFTPQVKVGNVLFYTNCFKQVLLCFFVLKVESCVFHLKEQMMLVSGHLDQRMKDIADQHNRALDSPQLNHKARK